MLFVLFLNFYQRLYFRYIYGGTLPLSECDASDIVKILVAANELSLQELVNYLQSFLIKSKANWVEQNFNLIFQTSFEYDCFLELQKTVGSCIVGDRFTLANERINLKLYDCCYKIGQHRRHIEQVTRKEMHNRLFATFI